jgi:hypothetical protein
MASRGIVPRADNEGTIGTTLKRWATAFIAVMNGITFTSGANTFNATVGTASLDVAPGAAADINANLTVTTATTLVGGNKTLTMSQNATLDEAVALSSKIPKTAAISGVTGSGTAGVLRCSKIIVYDGTAANTIKCTVINLVNGDASAVTADIAKGATVGNFSLDAGGTLLKWLASGITGTFIEVLSATMHEPSGTLTPTAIQCGNSGSNDMNMYLSKDSIGGVYDWTTISVGGYFIFRVLYMTDA